MSETEVSRIPVLTIGERVRVARRHAGFKTTAELADEIHVTRTTVARWESDAGEPRAGALRDLAVVCDVDLKWLMEGLSASLPTSSENCPGQGILFRFPFAAPMFEQAAA